MYLLVMLTACEISGRVQTIIYMMLPTTLVYGTHGMCSISSVDCGDEKIESLKWDAKGVLTGFAVFIPNCLSTFSMYFYERNNLSSSGCM